MSIHKNKNGYYDIRLRKKDIYGNTKQITIRGKSRNITTQRVAKEIEAMELLKPLEDKHLITFNELYKSYVLYSKNRLKERNINIIDNRVRLHILPYFSNRYIDKISVNDIMKWEDEINSKNYSYLYKTSLYNTFSTIMNYAVKFNNLKLNPLKLVGSFKDTGTEKKEMKFFTKDEFDDFIQHDDNIVYNTFFNLLYYSGLRLGESLALTWDDFKVDTISVKKSLSNKIKNKPYIITTPKTKSSIRDVLLPDNIIKQLNELRSYYSEFDGFSNSWFIFGGIIPLSETSIRRHKINACLKTKSKKEIRIHDFRHSHASLLINLGADILYISKRLGHSDVSETLNTYSHLYPSKQKEIVSLLNKL